MNRFCPTGKRARQGVALGTGALVNGGLLVSLGSELPVLLGGSEVRRMQARRGRGAARKLIYRRARLVLALTLQEFLQAAEHHGPVLFRMCADLFGGVVVLGERDPGPPALGRELQGDGVIVLGPAGRPARGLR